MSRWAENSFRKITLWATYREIEVYTPEWMVEVEIKEWYKLQSTDFISLLQGTVLLPQTSQIPLRTFHFWKLVSKNRSTIEVGVDYNICSPQNRTVSIYFCKKAIQAVMKIRRYTVDTPVRTTKITAKYLW